MHFLIGYAEFMHHTGKKTFAGHLIGLKSYSPL